MAILRELMETVGGGDTEGVLEKGEVNLGIEELIRSEDGWKPFWARGKDLVGYSINGLRSAGLGFETVGTERSSEVVRLVVEATETQRILDVSTLFFIFLFFSFGKMQVYPPSNWCSIYFAALFPLYQIALSHPKVFLLWKNYKSKLN